MAQGTGRGGTGRDAARNTGQNAGRSAGRRSTGRGTARRSAARATRRFACLLAIVLTAGACGIDPTEVRDLARPPVISYSPTWVTIYLLRDGRLVPKKIPVSSDSAKNIIDTLFREGKLPREGLTSALNDFSHHGTETTRYHDDNQRNDPSGNLGYRLSVIVTGGGEMSRKGLAQITCTIRQNKQESIWSVEVTRLFPGKPETWGEHTCFEYRDLAAKGVRLPP
ncbi:hypothetical protein [Streptosporangium sp. NPDC051022]|uniref:hypothetical protein n=1 Tax=Streptosporangium sp. NPDC051022 TaxID=3155752 RepID=UPI00342C104D